jgi:hypothetical protein
MPWRLGRARYTRLVLVLLVGLYLVLLDETQFNPGWVFKRSIEAMYLILQYKYTKRQTQTILLEIHLIRQNCSR